MPTKNNGGPRSAESRDREIGRRIRLLRVERKKSQQELGEELGVSFQQIQKYEKGNNRLSATRLIDIATVLKVSPIALLPVDGKIALATEAIDAETYRLAKAIKGVRPKWSRAVRGLITVLTEDDDE